MKKKSLTVILLSGGKSRRFGCQPKNLQTLDNKLVISHSFDLFQSSSLVDEIVVVCPQEQRELFPGATFAAPGFERTQSVQNGLECASSEFVCIHDGARPLLTADDFQKCFTKALEVGAAALAHRVTDTIKCWDKEGISTLDRSKLWAMQTPQIARKEWLLAAPLTHDVTDDLSRLEQAGYPVALVEGRRDNIKITHAGDIELAQFYLNQRRGVCSVTR